MNSISSSELYKHPELVGRSVNDYSFTKELINTVNNFNFKKDAYNTLSGTNDTEQSYIWTAISNIAETITLFNSDYYNDNSLSNITENTPSLLYANISEAFEDHILNYIDNIANIDICKVQSLQSMILQLGVSYNLFDKFKLMPLLLINLIDVLSIKREYLCNSTKIKELFTNLLYQQVSSFTSVDYTYEKSGKSYEHHLSDTISSLTDCRMSSVISATNETYYLSTLLDKVDVDLSTYIDSNKLYAFTSALYKNVLSDFCALRYNNKFLRIYADLSNNILLSDFVLYNTNSDKVEELNTFRIKYNIDKNFNESEEVDKIEEGQKTYDDYTTHELCIISAEIDYRSQPLSSSALYSRYYYYRQKTVKDFFKFVENEYANYLCLYLSTDTYNIDNSYLVVKNNNKTSLLVVDSVDKSLSLNELMIDYVAQVLADITESVRDIREQIKTQVLKNFIKGTKLHIEYMLREYIRNNIYPSYKKLANDLEFDKSNINDYQMSDIIVNINEYSDPTEYFNISTYIDKLSDNVNSRFWESKSTIRAVGPFNCNNIFTYPNIINSATQQNFNKSDVLNLYKLKLQVRFDSNLTLSAQDDYENDLNNHLSLFLYAVYDSGADTTYQDASGNICCNLDFNTIDTTKISELPIADKSIVLSSISSLVNALNTDLNIKTIVEKYSSTIDGLSDMTINTYNKMLNDVESILNASNKTLSDLNIIATYEVEDDLNWREYKEQLFKKYSGLSIGQHSFYNIKNQRHPSYQIHPYVNNFIDLNNITFPIENVANIVSEKITDMLINHVSCYLDEDGYLLNIWNNQLNTNSDYLSEYEKSPNKTPVGTVSKQIDYDGLFYPEALYDFIEDDYKFITDLCGEIDKTGKNVCKNKWYKDLDLTENERVDIANQLNNLKDYIKSEATAIHDIYRYGKDLYGNMYVLVKDLGIENINQYDTVTDNVKKHAPGIMWMRIKNHPIAFPMIYLNISKDENANTYSQIKYINDEKQLIKSNTKFDEFTAIKIAYSLSCPEIYDFTISKDKTEICFLGIANSKQYVIHTNIKKQFLKGIEQRHKYYLILDNFNNNLKGVDTDPGFEINSDVEFNTFCNFDNYIAVLETKHIVDTSKHILSNHIKLPYWNKNALDGNQLQTRLDCWLTCPNCTNDAANDCKVDITDNKRLTIAYRNILLDNTILSLSDYLGKCIKYPGNSSTQTTDTNSRLNIFTNSISTKDWIFDSKQFKETDFQRDYLPYNDMGFIPTYEYKNADAGYEQKYINNVYGVDNYQKQWFNDGIIKKGQLKFNLVGKPKQTSTDDYGIFFKNIVPVRMHEQYKGNLQEINDYLPSIYESKLKRASYFDVRYSELLSDTCLTSSSHIYDPYVFELTINYSNLSARIDESYINVFLNDSDLKNRHNITKQQLNEYNDIPYIWRCDDPADITQYPELFNPGISGQTIQALKQDTYVIRLSADSENNPIDEISVSWIEPTQNKYGQYSGIKLDFNTAYYNYNPETYNKSKQYVQFAKNYFNWKHQFLNLDKPGDSGYLRIWHDGTNGKKSEAGNVYFIKNISYGTDKPRFLLSLSSMANESETIEYHNLYGDPENDIDQIVYAVNDNPIAEQFDDTFNLAIDAE